MKIIVFNGSPWGEEGHTHVMVRQFLAGAIQAGARAQNIPLVAKKIEMCNRCGACFFKSPGKCTAKDDMPGLIKKFMASDVVIFATPVYIDNVTAVMKVFIDRLLPILEPHYEKDPLGEYRRRSRFRTYPKFAVISSCAMPEQSNFQVLQLFFRRMARTMHTEVVAEIYRSAAGILLLSREELQFKAIAAEYENLLRAAGEEFAKSGGISAKTSQKLEEPLIDADQYAEYANRMWDRTLPKHGLKVIA